MVLFYFSPSMKPQTKMLIFFCFLNHLLLAVRIFSENCTLADNNTALVRQLSYSLKFCAIKFPLAQWNILTGSFTVVNRSRQERIRKMLYT